MWDQDKLSAGMDAARDDFGMPSPVIELGVISNVLYICIKDAQAAVLAKYSYTLAGVLTRIGD